MSGRATLGAPLQPVHTDVRCALAAEESLVGPDVAPVAEAAAVGDVHVVQIAVDGLDRLRQVVVEDDVGDRQEHRALVVNLGAELDKPRPDEAVDRRLDPALGRAGQRTVLVAEVDLGLKSRTSLRHRLGREVRAVADPRERNVLVVEIGPLRLQVDRPVDADVDHDALAARQQLRRVLHILRRTLISGIRLGSGIDEISGRAVQVHLGRVFDPVPFPVVDAVDLLALERPVGASRRKFLHTLVGGEGDMDAFVEVGAVFRRVARRQTARARTRIVDRGRMPSLLRWCAAPRPETPLPTSV